MHDKDGRLLKHGDVVKFKSCGKTVIGLLTSITPGSETCNCMAVPVTISGMISKNEWCFTAKDCELILQVEGCEPVPKEWITQENGVLRR